jgi:hypothetical protein
MKLDFSREVLEKYSNTEFHEHMSNDSRVVQYGRTDRYDEACNRFSQFCQSAKTARGFCQHTVFMHFVR